MKLLIFLERDDFSLNRHLALSFCLSMIFSENRSPLFRIMLLVAALAAGLLALIPWSTYRRHVRHSKHAAIEYYGGWDGYGLPLHLTQKLTREEVEAREARGAAYLIGYFDADGKLIRDVKMHNGMVFFAHEYAYYPSGRLKAMKVTNMRGEVVVREYSESDLPTSVW